MKTSSQPAFLIVLVAAFLSLPAGAASNPGPENSSSSVPNPATALAKAHLLQLEISWDFGDLGDPDWRKELTEDDPTARFLLRWKHLGPSFESARLTVYDENDTYRGFLPLPLTTLAADGWRYTSFQIGDLPETPPVTMRVRLMNASGNQAGSASPEVQISVPEPDDPFLYTPLFIHGLQTDTGVPGLAGGVSCGAGRLIQERRFHAGVRKFDGGAGNIGSNDRWHWGSITKSMTATLLALLIDDGTIIPGGGGLLTWDTRLAAIWPEWSGVMHPRFIDTTLRHLACHRAGIYLNNLEWNLANTATGNSRDLRSQIAFSVLLRQQFHPKTGLATTLGTFDYRNENYFLLGAVIERLANAHYETLMQDRLFGPLGMTTCRWGVPPEFSYYQPHGHSRKADYPYDLYVQDKTLYPPQAPAGALYCTVADMLKYLRLHLNGSEGALSLQPATLAELHTPYPLQFAGDVQYAWGWGARMDGSRVSHNGSIGTYFALVSVDRNTGIVAATATNCGGRPENGGASAYGDDAVSLLHTHLEEKAQAKQAGARAVAGTFSAGSGRSRGIRESIAPELGWFPDLPDNGAAVLPEGSFPVSLHLSDLVNRRSASAARAPQISSLRRASDDLLILQFRSDPGAVYQVWSIPDLPTNRRHLLTEFEAREPQTTVEIPIEKDLPRAFFQIGDLSE